MGLNETAPARSAAALRWATRAGWATLISNIALVATGGAVRLTGSGLGCPTWPRCTTESFTPHGALGIHQAIEFGNRMLTFVLTVIAIATVIAAFRTRRRDLRRLSLALAAGIPAQAIIGGIVVRTQLNPWLVSLHLVCSGLIIAGAVVFLHRINHPGPWAAGRWTTLSAQMYAVMWAPVYIGTVVTGSGPHAGDAKAPRNGLDPLQVSQLHADAVFLLLGLTLALVTVTRPRISAHRVLARPAAVLLVVELLQAAIGFVQYFTGLPEVIVGAHLLGAAILIATGTWVLVRSLVFDSADQLVEPGDLGTVEDPAGSSQSDQPALDSTAAGA